METEKRKQNQRMFGGVVQRPTAHSGAVEILTPAVTKTNATTKQITYAPNVGNRWNMKEAARSAEAAATQNADKRTKKQ